MEDEIGGDLPQSLYFYPIFRVIPRRKLPPRFPGEKFIPRVTTLLLSKLGHFRNQKLNRFFLEERLELEFMMLIVKK